MRHFCILAPLLALTACSSPGSYIAKGNQLAEARHFDEASLNYRKAIQKDPSSSDANYRLGLSELKLGKVGESIEALQRAVDLAPGNRDAALRLTDLLLAAYVGSKPKSDELAVRLSKLADAMLAQNPNSYDGLRVKGAIALADGNAAEAIDDFQRANQAKPMQPELVQLLASALIRGGRAAEGERMALDLISRHKDYGPIYDLLSEYYWVQKRPGDAENILRTRVENNPGNGAYVIELASYLARERKEAESRAAVERMLNDPKGYPAGRMLAGDFYGSLGNSDEALRLYQEGAKLGGARQLEYEEKIANLLALAGKREEARSLVERILREHPDNEESRLARDQLLIDTGTPEGIDSAIASLKDLSGRRPEDTSLKYALGRAYAAKSDLTAARVQFTEAISNPGTYVLAHLALAQLDKLEQNWKSLQRHADFALLMEPANSGARLLRASALAGMGDFDKARFELQALLKDAPGLRDAHFQLGYVELGQGNYAAAEAIFKSQFIPGKGDVAGLGALTDLYCARKTCATALPLIKDELQRAPDSGAMQSLLAEAAMRAGDFDLAIGQYRQLLGKSPASANLHLRLGAAFFEKGDDAQAIVNFQKALSANPADLVSATMLASATGQPADKDKAIAACREALKDDPNNSAVENNLAVLIVERGGNLDEALALAQKAVEAMPWQAHFADTLGYVMAKKGMSDDAVGTLEKVVREHPADPAFHYHFAFALMTKGDRPGALSELQKALAAGPTQANKREIQKLLSQVN